MLFESLVAGGVGGCEHQSGILRREWGFGLWLWLLRQAQAYILDILVAGRREHQNGIEHGLDFWIVTIETGTRLHI